MQVTQEAYNILQDIADGKCLREIVLRYCAKLSISYPELTRYKRQIEPVNYVGYTCEFQGNTYKSSEHNVDNADYKSLIESIYQQILSDIVKKELAS